MSRLLEEATAAGSAAGSADALLSASEESPLLNLLSALEEAPSHALLSDSLGLLLAFLVLP